MELGNICVVNVSDCLLTIIAGGRGPGCAALVGIVVRYTLLYIIGGIMGRSLSWLFNGPTPAMLRATYGELVLICNLFFWGIHYLLVQTWAYHTAGRGHNIWFRSPGAQPLLAGDWTATQRGGQRALLRACDRREQ